MKQPEIVEILFEPEKHEYTVNGEKADISVTTLIGKQVTHDEYFNVDPAVLKRAADRGTDVHADLEYFVGKGTEPRTQECKNFAAYIKANGWIIEHQLCEFKLAIKHTVDTGTKICSFILSGTADLMCKLNGKWVVVDHKTTSTIHEESVRWQMSLLDYMARQLSGSTINGYKFDYEPAEELYVFHFDKQAVFRPVKVERIPDIEIERLLDAEAKKEEYHPTPVDILTPRQMDELLDVEKKIASLKLAKKALDNQEAQLRAAMEEAFAAHPGTKKVELPHVTVTYKVPSTKQTFDVEKFQQDHPDLYKQYLVTTPVKGSVTITLSKDVQASLEARTPDVAIQQLPPPKRKNTKRGYFS
ncbi:MAG: PD-(D/E)XK nuclease family protein [Acetobacter sp.]|nr:PD-(D/E)XK nuclease family protein [Acetobacter sp.]